MAAGGAAGDVAGAPLADQSEKLRVLTNESSALPDHPLVPLLPWVTSSGAWADVGQTG